MMLLMQRWGYKSSIHLLALPPPPPPLSTTKMTHFIIIVELQPKHAEWTWADKLFVSTSLLCPREEFTVVLDSKQNQCSARKPECLHTLLWRVMSHEALLAKTNKIIKPKTLTMENINKVRLTASLSQSHVGTTSLFSFSLQWFSSTAMFVFLQGGEEAPIISVPRGSGAP